MIYDDKITDARNNKSKRTTDFEHVVRVIDLQYKERVR